METVWNDVRYAIRGLRNSPIFTVIVVATLALGIGANAVVFGVVRTVLLNPLPYADSDQLVNVVEADGRTPNPETVSYATAQDLKHRTNVFDRLSLWGDAAVRPVHNGVAVQLRGMRVTADFFETLRVRMFMGRSFRPEEDTPDGPDVIVLTHGTWMEHFGGDPTIVGRAIQTIGGPYTVIGILPPQFHPLHMSNPAELPTVFMPLGFDRAAARRSPASRSLRAIGRLKSGVTVRQAQAQVNTLMRTLVGEYPDYPNDASAVVTSLREQLVGRFGAALWMVQLCVLVLLLLACANAAMLLLARTVGRETALAIRAALGAGGATLARQLFTECLLLSGAAAALGVSIAWAATQLIARTADTNIPRINELAPDASMLLAGIVAAVATAALFGLAPAVAASRRALAMLRTGQNVIGRRSHHAILRMLVAGEMALACGLVLVVALLGKSYVRLMQVDPGYDPHDVLTLSLLPDGVHYGTPPLRLGYYDSIAGRMRTIPGVEDAAYASTLPLSHPSTRPVFVREHPAARDAEAANLDTYLVSTNYLHVMRIPILKGRGFITADGPRGSPVAVMSESAARTQFRDEDPIGRHVQIGSRDDRAPWATIVGVVGDVHQYALDRKPDAAVYIPFAQVVGRAQPWASLVVRSTPGAGGIEPAVRAAMAAVDPLQPVFHLQPMARYIALSVSQRTFALALVTAFGVLGLVLAMGGVYGVVSYVVEQRTREVGLRLALGARPIDVAWMVVRQVLLVTAAGVSCGLVLAAMFADGVSALLYGVTRFDLGITIGAALGLMVAALAASAVPVARAARVAPMAALRSE